MTKRKNTGFTLLEMLLVLAIISVLLAMGINYYQQKMLSMRIERTVIQSEQILNAGLAYFVANGKWPCAAGSFGESSGCPLDNLISQNYLPNKIIVSPWGQKYEIGVSASDTTGTIKQQSNFYVYTQIPAMVNSAVVATTIMGQLPMAYISSQEVSEMPPQSSGCTDGTSCYVIASVNIPGQTLNYASAVNFAGIYNHGACVPQPDCPATTTPQILVTPTSVSGWGGAATSGGASNAIYPISSFSAYARGSATSGTSPPVCDDGYSIACTDASGNSAANYWRVCLQLVTEKGPFSFAGAGANFAQGITLMAITRCAISNEQSGSAYQVFTP